MTTEINVLDHGYKVPAYLGTVSGGPAKGK